jgi:hypothetical protein
MKNIQNIGAVHGPIKEKTLQENRRESKQNAPSEAEIFADIMTQQAFNMITC